MLKRIYISLCVAMLMCMTMPTGCSENEISVENVVQEQTDGEQAVGAENSTAEAGGEECFAEEAGEEWERISQGNIPKAGAIAEEVFANLPEGSVSQYPKIVSLPQKRIELVMYSEGYYCIFNGSFYGFMTEDGEEIAPYIYEQASPFSEELACVCLDGKYGYIGKDGETVIPFMYDQASPFTDGLAYFRTGSEYGFIDHEGKVVLQPECDSVSSFQEGRAYFSIDGLYGYLDKIGKIIVEPVYEDAGYFWDGLAKVTRNGCYGMIGMDGKYGVLRRDGEIEIPMEYDRVKLFQNGATALKTGHTTTLYDSDGKTIYSDANFDLGILINECGRGYRIEENKKYGILDETGEQIIDRCMIHSVIILFVVRKMFSIWSNMR